MWSGCGGGDCRHCSTREAADDVNVVPTLPAKLETPNKLNRCRASQQPPVGLRRSSHGGRKDGTGRADGGRWTKRETDGRDGREGSRRSVPPPPPLPLSVLPSLVLSLLGRPVSSSSPPPPGPPSSFTTTCRSPSLKQVHPPPPTPPPHTKNLAARSAVCRLVDRPEPPTEFPIFLGPLSAGVNTA